MKSQGTKTPSLFPMLKSRQEMVMAGGRLSQILGYPKSVGQIYGFLFFAHKPQSLDDIAGELGVSKASVSNGVRQLLAWGIVRQVWVQGDRREFIEVTGDVPGLFKAGYSDFVKPKVDSSKRRIEGIGRLLEEEHQEGSLSAEEFEFTKRRFGKLSKIQTRLEKLLPLLERLV
jgi:HTH-type transcriptional regulator, glycine betaine synthesis regulator